MRGIHLAMALTLAALTSCGDAAQRSPDAGPMTGCATIPKCPPSSPSFAADVQPILDAHCAPCHFPGGKEQQRLLTDYPHVFPQRQTLLGQLASCVMPPTDAPTPLPDAQRTTLLTWLVCGAPEN